MRNLIFLSFLIYLTGCVKSNPDQIQIVIDWFGFFILLRTYK
jgi:hypothetical protein